MAYAARDNPFATERVESMIPFDPSWVDSDWDSICERFEQAGFRGSVVGPHGSGKTTFLDAFESILRERTGFSVCRLFLNDERTTLTRQERIYLTNCGIQETTVIFLDGEERMNFFDRMEFARLSYGFGGLLVTRHGPRRGISTILETSTRPAMLRDFVNRLMPDFPGDGGMIDSLYRENGGNIREALRMAYDHVAKTDHG